jgi:anhydro-N-acetylmuramic acid kinase
MPFDKDGLIAGKGKVCQLLLEAMLDHPFFGDDFPKTCGPELFNMEFIEAAKVNAGQRDISPGDLIATLTQLTAEAIINALNRYKDLQLIIYGSGGGYHNPAIMGQLEMLPNVSVRSTQDLGINPDAKEAILFAVLANETLSDSSVPIGNAPGVSMGKISFPG